MASGILGRSGKAARSHVAPVSRDDIGLVQAHRPLCMGTFASETQSNIVCVTEAIVETIP